MKNKGFTLIELLVVIAIIGILSGIVLTSLGSARNKAKDASIQGSLSSMKAEAELNVTASGAYPGTLCTGGTGAWTGKLATLLKAVENNSVVAVCNEDTASWAASAPLASDATKYFCVDSTGFSGVRNTALGTGKACPAS